MREGRRRLFVGGKGVLTFAALIAAGCEGVTQPPSAAVLEAVTETALTGVEFSEIRPVPTVRVLDEDGDPVGGVLVSWDLKRRSGRAGRTAVVSTADGIASVGSWLSGSAGMQTLTARSGESRVEFVLQAEVLTWFERVDGDQQSAAPGQALPLQLGVRLLQDEDGWPLPGATVTFTVMSGGGSIEGASAITAADGYAESGTWTLGPEVGPQQVRAESGRAWVVFIAYANEPS